MGYIGNRRHSWMSGKDKIKRLPLEWDEDKRLWIKCLSCGHKWFPDARRWKDRNDPKDYKIVRCPECRARNPLPPSVVRFLKKQARKYPEFGLGNPPGLITS